MTGANHSSIFRMLLAPFFVMILTVFLSMISRMRSLRQRRAFQRT